MAFYSERVVAAEIQSDGIYIARKVKDSIQIEYIKENTNVFHKYTPITDILGDFDMDLDINNKLNIIYLDKKEGLNLYRFKGDKKDIKSIETDISTGIYELSLINNDDTSNIFFMIPITKRNYRIFHYMVKENEVSKVIVDDIKIFNIINPLRIIKNNDELIIAYYYENQICTKIFNFDKNIWSPSMIMTDNMNKLYLDIIFFDKRLHIVYAEYDMENFRIKYERFLYNSDNIIKEKEIYLSNNDNNVDPILIRTGSKLWAVWRNGNLILSVFSKDNGNTWSDVYQWKNTKKQDFVKYRYITNIKNDKVKIDFSYGTIREVALIGFGNIKEADIYYKRK